MKKAVFVFAACMAAQFAFGIAASQAWVTNYVRQAISSSLAELQTSASVTNSGGVTTLSTGSGLGQVRIVIEDATDAALVATNCTSSATAQGVTNGCTFVWNGAGSYVNPHGTISCTSTNMTFSGVGSVHTNGMERFTGWFDAYGVLIQPHTSLSITNGMTEVQQ